MWQWIYQAITEEFDGVERPRIGFFQENLAATRPSVAPDYVNPSGGPPFTLTPNTNFVPSTVLGNTNNWMGFQALTPWSSPFHTDHVTNTLNGTPFDGLNGEYNTFSGYYAEIYPQDLDHAASPSPSPTPWDAPRWAAGLQAWHDYAAHTRSQAPIEPPAGLTVTPSGSQNTVTWSAAYIATYYDVQHRLSSSDVWVTITPPGGTNVRSLTESTGGQTYFYRVSVHGANKWSKPIAAAIFYSQASYDGYVVDSSPQRTVVVNAAEPGIHAGTGTQGGSSYDMRGFLSFDTSGLPDSSTSNPIISAKLRLKQGTADTAFQTLGLFKVDIKSPYFFTSVSLQKNDFDDTVPSDAINVGQMPRVDSGTWAEARLNHASFGYINRTGTTQFRIYFDNPSEQPTYVGWYSGGASDAPQLLVQYSDGT
jgi:hypothetical protein